jgi:cystathionine beta-lyase/cystathionine gamma-synthase
MRKTGTKVVALLVLALSVILLFSCGLAVKERIIYEVDGSGTATISYTNKYGSTTIMMNQTLPWYKPIYYLFDEETDLEKIHLEVTASSPVTTSVTWDR